MSEERVCSNCGCAYLSYEMSCPECGCKSHSISHMPISKVHDIPIDAIKKTPKNKRDLECLVCKNVYEHNISKCPSCGGTWFKRAYRNAVVMKTTEDSTREEIDIRSIPSYCNSAYKDTKIGVSISKAAQYTRSGFTHLSNNNYQAAIVDYSKAIEIEPNNAKLYVNRGVAYNGIQLYNKALSDFDKCLSLEPNSIPVLKNAAIACRDGLCDYEKAIYYYSKMADLEKDNWEHCYNLAFCYQQLGKYQEAGAFRALSEQLKGKY